MKLICILISFALVNVLVAKLDDYVKQFLITNNHIKLAKRETVFMLATPEKDNPCLKPHDMIDYEKLLQSEISAATGIDAPQVKEENLAKLLKDRITTTTTSLRSRIIRASDNIRPHFLTELRSARRIMTMDALKLLIGQKDPLFSDLYEMCRLIALFRSIKYPRLYEGAASFNIFGRYCYIINAFRNTKVYTFIDGEISEVEPNPENHAPIRPFSHELHDHELQ
ncbi:uncharacterized protein LOC126835788 isoform X2 [Adelges cooleyi]|uniref:uncharacterized protein LOC126835788 isoform X2 n=1 Tax=Adelges cooleyi TaxID=133065 RepID=UPI00217F8B6C|nr:uncharacterized protein LOC126835788 isoform X2 [Adelges cooleyi]